MQKYYLAILFLSVIENEDYSKQKAFDWLTAIDNALDFYC